MHKARKEMLRVLPETDVILEVLDARIPYSSENPMLAGIRGNKPCLKVLTKADLADEDMTQVWLATFSGNTFQTTSATQETNTARATNTTRATAVTTAEPASILALPRLLKSMIDADKKRIKPFVAMVVGIPNAGKSTLINVLAGRTVAKTGNEPAITKRQQHINLQDNWVLRDTPGVLWPNVANRHSGYRLAATGAIRDTAMDSSDVAAHLLDYLREAYASQLQARFGMDLPLDDSVATLEAIGEQRGCLSGGGLVDFDRAARVLLQEFRSGQLGTMTLETPAMMARELELVEAQRIKSEAVREERRLRRQKARRKRRS
jgi:ribosome biogenesis GTPase A